MDGVFRFTLPSVQTITAVELQGNGAWNVNGGWVPGVSATPGSDLLNAANGTVKATGLTFTIYAADGGTDRFLPDAVMTITVVTAAGTVTGAMTIANTPQSATLTLNPAQRLQTFQGWEGGILSSVEDYDGITPAKWGDIFGLAVAEGYTRMRLSIRSGVEGSGTGYKVDNDNRNPNVIKSGRVQLVDLRSRTRHCGTVPAEDSGGWETAEYQPQLRGLRRCVDGADESRRICRVPAGSLPAYADSKRLRAGRRRGESRAGHHEPLDAGCAGTSHCRGQSSVERGRSFA